MGLSINLLKDSDMKKDGKFYIADKDYFWNADKSELVEQGTEAAFLYCRQGARIPEDMAKEYGLVKASKKSKNKASKKSKNKSKKG